MKRILVLVKQIPTAESVRLNEETGTMFCTGSDAAINPRDLLRYLRWREDCTRRQVLACL